MCLISVIVPVYNVEKYLSRCVESILVQTFKNFELILVNDGSKDNCAEIMKKYEMIDARIKTIYQDNQGLSSARNAGIDIAEGEYLTFVDSDDYIYPDYLEKLVDAIERNHADISICGNVRFSSVVNPEPTYNFYGEKIITKIQACKYIYDTARGRANYVVAWGKLYKKELFANERYPVGKLHEDQFITYKLMYISEKIVEIGACLYGYYDNSLGIMNSPFTMKRYDGVEAFEEAEAFFKQKQQYDIANKIHDEKIFLIAQNSIKARKAGIYHLIPKEYRMSFFVTKRKLKEIGGIDWYE